MQSAKGVYTGNILLFFSNCHSHWNYLVSLQHGNRTVTEKRKSFLCKCCDGWNRILSTLSKNQVSQTTLRLTFFSMDILSKIR
ncbi:hypothetical protein LXL04_022857 [Taraxacum kok-saghyz]